MDHEHPEMNRRVTDLADELLECKSEVGRELEKGNKRMNGLGVQIDEVAASLNDLAESIESLLEIFMCIPKLTLENCSFREKIQYQRAFSRGGLSLHGIHQGEQLSPCFGWRGH